MKSIEIKGSVRAEIGKKASKAVRTQGSVPCVIYGGAENVNFFVETPALKPLVYSPNVYLVNINVDGKVYTAIMKELQFHPVTDEILHIDFVQVSDKKAVTMNIPIHVVGNSIGVKKGGRLSLVKRSLKVKALPKNLPDVLDVNVETLDVGQSVKVGDLNFENITVLNNSREPIVSILSSRTTAKVAAEGDKK
jgi:large subunit ribosomal protein L25